MFSIRLLELVSFCRVIGQDDMEGEWVVIKAGVQALQKVGWLVPVIAKEYKLEDAAQAHTDIRGKTSTLGKLVLDVAGN